MARIGYARVSTTGQDEALQLEALDKAGVSRTFTDKGVSGAKAERPQLTALLDHVRAGDVVVVWKLDRIARNTKNLLELVERLDALGVGFESITESIGTTGPMGKAMLTIMGAFAELERSQMIERTRAGLEVARSRGRLGGRPGPDAAVISKAKALHAKGLTADDVAATLKVSRATAYRYINA
jgi:DNA invertase Pin-like site-specific DNA recombinase